MDSLVYTTKKDTIPRVDDGVLFEYVQDGEEAIAIMIGFDMDRELLVLHYKVEWFRRKWYSNKGRLSEEEINKIVADAEKYKADDDEEKRKTIQRMN